MPISAYVIGDNQNAHLNHGGKATAKYDILLSSQIIAPYYLSKKVIMNWLTSWNDEASKQEH